MKIDNPRFKPEDLFTEKYWGEIKPPIEGYKARSAPKSERRAISRQLAELVLPILRGRIHGSVLPEGAAYNPSDPNLTGLAQHLPGAVTLLDREYLREKPQPPDNDAEILPIDEDHELELHLPSRQFVTHSWKGSHPWPSHVNSLWHDGMKYSRSVRVEAIASQYRNNTPVTYTPMPFPIYNEAKDNLPIWRTPQSDHAERIGVSYEGRNGGWWRITMVEICQQGTPVEAATQSEIRLGNLAVE